MTPTKTKKWVAVLNLTMQGHTDNEDDTEKKSHAEKVRSRMDTKDLGSIMGRFYRAVSWRNN